jgi:hypothetical protein
MIELSRIFMEYSANDLAVISVFGDWNCTYIEIAGIGYETMCFSTMSLIHTVNADPNLTRAPPQLGTTHLRSILSFQFLRSLNPTATHNFKNAFASTQYAPFLA